MSRTLRLLLLAAALWASAAPASAQIHVGPQASLGSDSGLGLGGRLLFPLRAGILGMDGALDGNYFFGGGRGVDSWIDANANVRIPVPISPDFTTRIGAGLNATFISLDVPGVGTDTESHFGFNVLGSIELARDNFAPFLELRATLSGAEQVVLTVGFTFGGTR